MFPHLWRTENGRNAYLYTLVSGMLRMVSGLRSINKYTGTENISNGVLVPSHILLEKCHMCLHQSLWILGQNHSRKQENRGRPPSPAWLTPLCYRNALVSSAPVAKCPESNGPRFKLQHGNQRNAAEIQAPL